MKITLAFAAPLALLCAVAACSPSERNFDTGGAGGSGGAGQGGGGGDFCPTGTANCDENPDCEMTTIDNPKACGACGVVCKGACVGTTCNDVAHIYAGFRHTCALTTLGDLYCWGRNKAGELGVGSVLGDMVAIPTKVATSGPVKAVALGGASVDPPVEYAHTCAIIADGTAQCWGSNTSGELGAGQVGWQDTPSTVVSFVKGRDISVGGAHSCALTEANELYCWGSNGNGQLGIGQMGGQIDAPKLVRSDVKLVSAGRDHTCAITTGGDLYCWGKNVWGRLGIGNQMDQNIPVLVSLPGVDQISAGGEHTCARNAGDIFCWGNGYQGQLGIPNEFSWREKPTDAFGISPSIALSAGGQHTASISGAENFVYVSSSTIPVGNGTMNGDYVPLMTTVSGAAEVATGAEHTCALTQDKRIFCWGANVYGQLGSDTGGMLSYVPIEVVLPVP